MTDSRPLNRRRGALLAAFALIASTFAVGAGTAQQTAPPAALVDVIVRAVEVSAAQTQVVESGGTLGAELGIIDGFSATVPASAIPALQESEAITAITPNTALQLSAAGWEDADVLGGMDPNTHPASLYEVTKYTSARSLWAQGHTGAGVDVALIDSGVVPVNGLTVPGKIVNGPDLSFESQYDGLRHLDTFGHGTHLAGIIAGRDDEVSGNYTSASGNHFLGVAPDARIVSIKVADAHGVTDVSQVIAAIDWVVQHRNDGDLDIRVLSLSFGTDSTQSYVLDPLAFAVEKAWESGIVVVVAAGNDGNQHALRNPAMDPFVIAVGATDPNGTNTQNDDTVATFSNCGVPARSVDVVAHGRSITSLRAPGSYADLEHPEAVVAERLFVGSGTSQAAAVVTGVVALMLDEDPGLDPDQVKSLLISEANQLSNASSMCQGGGAVDAAASASGDVPKPKDAYQTHIPSTGTGTLEGSRGTDHLTADGIVLEGEQDIMGSPWVGFNEVTEVCAKDGEGQDAVTVCSEVLIPVATLWDLGDWNGETWSGSSWSGSSWSGSSWSGSSWSGSSWSGSSWSSITWSGSSWSGSSWSGSSWSGSSWSGSSWSGSSWSGSSWSGSSWSGSSWSGSSWSGSSWSGAGWLGLSWD